LDFGGLQYSGNFARGVQFGSNQDLSLNSNLDLRLSGKIANDIEIIAALSDQNIHYNQMVLHNNYKILTKYIYK
jgi:hypothetical protein